MMSRRLAPRPTDADFARPLRHRRQHDVHDADAAHDQRDAGDQHQQYVEHHPQQFRLPQQFFRHHDTEIRFLVVLLQQRADDLGGFST